MPSKVLSLQVHGSIRAPAVLALGLAALVVASCGGSPATSSFKEPAGAVGTPQQLFVATVINLRASDFPSGWTQYTNDGPPNSNVIRTSMDFCTRSVTSNPQPQAMEASPNFIDNSTGGEVGSQVEIMASTVQASKAISAAQNGDLNSCLQKSVTSGLNQTLPSEEKLTNESVATISVPRFGDASSGVRLASDISFNAGGKQQSARVYVDVIGFHTGAVVVNTMFENPTTPPSASLERQLVGNMAGRARPT